jgi:VanZ family protein
MYNAMMKLKTLTLLFAFLILAVIILADTGSLGFLAFVYNFPYGDKAGHFILYGILSFLLNLTLLRSLHISTPKRVAVIVTLILALAIGAEEYSQRFFANRTSDWMDLLFSYIGVALGAWLAYRKKRP